MNWRDWDSAVSRAIVERPRYIFVAFLLVTAIFGVGMLEVSTDAGTEQFTEDLEEFEAMEQVDQEFGAPFSVSTGSTQLIQVGENVVSERAMLRMLRVQEAAERNPDLRVTATRSPASAVAEHLDPAAETAEQQVRVMEAASASEVRRAVRAVSDDPAFAGSVSDDFNPETPEASAAIGVLSHDIEVGVGGGPEGGGGEMASVQRQMTYTADSFGGDVRVFGSGIIQEEFNSIVGDSLSIVIPASILLIVLFLVVAYRDPFDLVLSLAGLLMAVVWTLGFMGFADIPFNETLVALPPIILAIGIDFSIHAVNRFREERVKGFSVTEAMSTASSQLIVAFAIVAGTTSIGFAANVISAFQPTRNFGVVAAVSIVFVLLIFGVWLPAAKVLLERWRSGVSLPDFSSTPLGMEGGRLAGVLTLGTRVTVKAPYLFVALFVVVAAASGAYATGVDTTFTEEDFLPPEEIPAHIQLLPGPLAPSDYTVVENINLLQDKFEAGAGEEVQMYLEGRLNSDRSLQSISRAGEDPPSSFVDDGRRAESTSVVTVIQGHATEDPEFAALVSRNDRSGDGVPDSNVDEVLDALLASEAGDRALEYVSSDRRSALVSYSVEADAEEAEIVDDAWNVADRHRLEATPTGEIVLFQAVTDLILEDAVNSMLVALLLISVFMALLYGAFEGRPVLGLVNLFPVLVAVSLLGGTMRLFDIPFNAITATILAITIGLGIDYTVHVTHRFVDEYHASGDAYEALLTTTSGTGGALTGTMLTTASGTLVLVLAIIPIIGQFGILTAASVFYAYLASLVVLPPALMIWADYFG